MTGLRTADIIRQFEQLADPVAAQHAQRFFRTGTGEYGEGDRFLGIRVPVIREQVKKSRDAFDLPAAVELLQNPWHEIRLYALLAMADRYGRSRCPAEQRDLYRAYMRNIPRINNWDLVDCSAEHIPGAYLYSRNRAPLYRLARSPRLWDRRVAVMATFHFIRRHDYGDTLALAEMLLTDREDLIHKAAGWMLREIGNRDRDAETAFLDRHHRSMPRTMLRYAIEKFPEKQRQAYLKGLPS